MVDLLAAVYPIAFILIGGLLILAHSLSRPDDQDSPVGKWILGLGIAFVFAGAVLLMVEL